MKNECYWFSTTSTLSGWKNCRRRHWKTLMDNVAGTAGALRLAQPAKEVLFRRQTQVMALCSQREGITQGPSLWKSYCKFKSCFDSSMAFLWSHTELDKDDWHRGKLTILSFALNPDQCWVWCLLSILVACLCKGGDSATEAISSCSADRFLLASITMMRFEQLLCLKAWFWV